MIRIRIAQPDDLPACAALDHSIVTDYVWQMGLSESDGKLSVSFRTVRLPRSMRVLYPRSTATLQDSLSLDDCSVYVAELERKIVGYISMVQQLSENIGLVSNLAVDVANRKQGIAASLLSRAQDLAHEREYQRLIVETTTKNFPAITFLQKSNLVFCGYNDLYYANHDIALFFGQNLP